MFEVIGNWFKRHFSDPQVVMLAVLLLFGFLVVIYFGEMLAPVLASLVIAYLLEGLIGLMRRRSVPRLIAVWTAFLLFIVVLVFLIFGLVPLLSTQVAQFVQELPSMISRGQGAIMQLPERYPDFINQQQLADLLNRIRAEIATAAQSVLAFSLSSLTSVVTLVVYLVLLPLLVFFFLKDRQLILDWVGGFLPAERPLLRRIWSEMNEQFANYARGKVLEVLIVGSITYFAFIFLGVTYAALLV